MGKFHNPQGQGTLVTYCRKSSLNPHGSIDVKHVDTCCTTIILIEPRATDCKSSEVNGLQLWELIDCIVVLVNCLDDRSRKFGSKTFYMNACLHFASGETICHHSSIHTSIQFKRSAIQLFRSDQSSEQFNPIKQSINLYRSNLLFPGYQFLD